MGEEGDEREGEKERGDLNSHGYDSYLLKKRLCRQKMPLLNSGSEIKRLALLISIQPHPLRQSSPAATVWRSVLPTRSALSAPADCKDTTLSAPQLPL